MDVISLLAARMQFYGVQVLRLNDCGLGAGGAMAIAGALARLHRMLELEMFGNALGVAGAQAILDRLAEGSCKQLQRLDLWGNSIECKAVAGLFIKLEAGCPSLRAVNLGACKLRVCADGLDSNCEGDALMSPKYEPLCCVLSAASAAASYVCQSETRPHLQELRMAKIACHAGANELGPEGAAAIVSSLPSGCTGLRHLEHVLLCSNAFGQAGAAAIAHALAQHLPQLQTVALTDNGVSDRRAVRAAMRKLPSCTLCL